MKLLRSLTFFVTLAAIAVVGVVHGAYGAWIAAFTGFAALAAAPAGGVLATNTIASELQITRVLDAAIMGFKTALAPLKLFSTAVNRDPYGAGNDSGNTITVPVYDYTTGDVQTRTSGQAYSGKVSNTTTSARQLTINTEKVVGISFTNEEAQNQVSFDPVTHGMIKGRDLARTVINDIFSVVRYGNYPNATLAAMAATSFDVNDVADLAQKAMEANWPQEPQPGLALNPAFYYNLAKQAGIIDASQSGTNQALTTGRILPVMGFNVAGSNGIPSNNATGTTFTATAATDVCASTAHGLLTGDQVVVSNSGGGLPTGLSASTYYYVIKIDADSFKLASSLANAVAGTAIDIGSTGTGTHTVTLATNLVGVAGAPSGIITGFRPVIPTPGIRSKLVAWRLVDDAESGLTLEYRHIANEDTGVEYQVIGCHYGKTYGNSAALKLLSTPAP